MAIALSSLFFPSLAQADTYWNASGNNIYNTNTGYVGLGTSSPGMPLDINFNEGIYLGTSHDMWLTIGNNNVYLRAAVQDKDLNFQVNDGGTIKTAVTVDGPTSYLGIGTESPQSALDIRSDSGLRLGDDQDLLVTSSVDGDITFKAAAQDQDVSFQINDGGTTKTAIFVDASENKVGIGLTNPGAHLEIKDDSYGAGENMLQIGDDTYFADIDQSNVLGLYGVSDSSFGRIKFGSGGPVVGSKNGSSAFRVDGTLIAEEIIVQSDAWADYVFDNGYNLRPLNEVERYIEENGHLPDVPSAEEVSEGGVNVGEMNKILLQKIEEQTLYTLGLKKENNELKARLDKLENVSNQN